MDANEDERLTRQEKANRAAALLTETLSKQSWQRVALLWQYYGLRVVTGAETTPTRTELAAAPVTLPTATGGRTTALDIMDHLLGSVFELVAEAFSASHFEGTRGSECLFLLQPFTKAYNDEDLPYFEASDGSVVQLTRRMMERFAARLSFDFAAALDLLTTASLDCVSLPTVGELMVACNETIIATLIKDVFWVDLVRKPNAGWRLYMCTIFLPRSGKSFVIHVLPDCFRYDAAGKPIRDFLKPTEVMSDASQFLSELTRTHHLTRDITLVMDAYFSHPDILLFDWRALGFKGSVGLQKYRGALTDLLGHGLEDRCSRMVSVRDILVSIYRDGADWVLNASTAFKCTPSDIRAAVHPVGFVTPPRHSLDFAYVLSGLYGLLEGDCRLLAIGLLSMPPESRSEVLLRATGWSAAQIDSTQPSLALWNAVQALADQIKATLPNGVDGAVAGEPNPPQASQPLLTTTTAAPGPSAGQQRQQGLRRSADSSKKAIEQATSDLLIKKGYVQEEHRNPDWKLVVDLGSKMGLAKRSGETRLDFKRRLLEAAGVDVADMADGDTVVVEETATSADDGGASDEPEDQAVDSPSAQSLPADVLLPAGWRDLISTTEELNKLTVDELKKRMRELDRNVKLTGEKERLVREYRRMLFKLHVDPEYVRATISRSSIPGKTVPMVFHGEYSAVDRFDQYMSYVSKVDRVKKKHGRLLRWITEAAVCQTYALLAEDRHGNGQRAFTALDTLREIRDDFDLEQEGLRGRAVHTSY